MIQHQLVSAVREKMPIFDYRCEDCAEDFEYFSVRSADKPHCPKCGSTRLEKKLGGRFAVGKSATGKKLPADGPPNAEHSHGDTGHRCTSSCSHGSASTGAGVDAAAKVAAGQGTEGHVVGCARSYADSLREKYR